MLYDSASWYVSMLYIYSLFRWNMALDSHEGMRVEIEEEESWERNNVTQHWYDMSVAHLFPLANRPHQRRSLPHPHRPSRGIILPTCRHWPSVSIGHPVFSLWSFIFAVWPPAEQEGTSILLLIIRNLVPCCSGESIRRLLCNNSVA